MDEIRLEQQCYPVHVPVDKAAMDRITKHLFGVSVNTDDIHMSGVDLDSMPYHLILGDQGNELDNFLVDAELSYVDIVIRFYIP